ncbi:MAG TPA: YcnI family protein [Amycolatopsis sp.]|uniref:YcnI family copper-binding membrane protein n=1 Tax=Amycolatopsis sp. TaxID=37632 RepID=UPI002B49A6D9|nr:YcnI family protein [Amycolatopsis sp.]HKS46672.1 YcnI family protein [Amycolatopsis sp.]
MSKKRVLRAIVVIGAVGATGLLGAGIASAHVTANSYGSQPQKGGYGTVVFRVPNEEQDAGTVKLEVDFKPEYALSSVRYEPIPGWTAEVTRTQLPAPVKNGKNLDVNNPVTKIVWTAQPGGGIAKGADQFQDFEITLSTLPSNVDELVLPALQTYSDNKVVGWNEVTPANGQEPEHPAPTVKLAAATGDGHDGMAGMSMGSSDSGSSDSGSSTDGSASNTDTTARWLGGAGLVVGALGLGFGAGATLRARKATKSAP